MQHTVLRRLRKYARKVALGVGAAGLVTVLAGVAPASAAPTGGGAPCAECHEEATASFNSSFHAKAWKGANGCQSCHGSADRHLDDPSKKTIVSFSKDGGRSAKERAAQCLGCHSSSSHVAFWETSKHKSVGMACDSCHTGHSSLPRNLKMSEPELCYSCHKDIRSQANRQSHHPIREGKISCTSCHDPHGGFGVKMIKADSINELCYTCHADKRGPFMWEHPPVEENCMTCHTAHGSNHSQLLVRKGPQLCQSCHDWTQHPSTPYAANGTFTNGTPARQLVGRNCQNCHTNVHGSNGAASLGLRFIR
jgi:DmsE family decaheme c-type cytochrome